MTKKCNRCGYWLCTCDKSNPHISDGVKDIDVVKKPSLSEIRPQTREEATRGFETYMADGQLPPPSPNFDRWLSAEDLAELERPPLEEQLLVEGHDFHLAQDPEAVSRFNRARALELEEAVRRSGLEPPQVQPPEQAQAGEIATEEDLAVHTQLMQEFTEHWSRRAMERIQERTLNETEHRRDDSESGVSIMHRIREQQRIDEGWANLAEPEE